MLIFVSSILRIVTITRVGLPSHSAASPAYPSLPMSPLNRALHTTWFESHWLLRILSRLVRMIRRKHLESSRHIITITVVIMIVIIFRKR